MYIFIFLLCAILSQVQGLIVERKCEDQPAKIVKPFHIFDYLGVWYEQERYEVIFESGKGCIVSNYSKIANSYQKFRIKNTHTILKDNVTGTSEGLLYSVNPFKNEGRYVIQFPKGPGNDYWIIGTDYVNYSVVWSCMDIANSKSLQFLWILSRKPRLDDDKQVDVNDILNRAELDKTKLVKTFLPQCSVY